MADQSIFSNTEATKTESVVPAAPAAQQPSSQPNAIDYLSAIKNERGEVKYSSVEEALKGAAHAQELIKNNSLELQQLREELETARAEAAKLKGSLNAMDLLSQPHKAPEENPPVIPQGLDEAKVVALFEQYTANKSKAEIAAANRSKVTSALVNKFGDKAESVFYTTAQSLGISKEFMNGIAENSPEAALKFFEGISPTNINPIKPSLNTNAIPATEVQGGPLPRGNQSMLLGATSQQQKDEMARHRAAVWAKHGITG